MAPPIALDEEMLDDILYFARTNEKKDLLDTINALSSAHAVSPFDVLAAAVDTESGNTAIHYAAANGHADLLRAVFASEGTNKDQHKRQARRDLIRCMNGAKNTALHYASMNGQLDAVRVVAAAALPVYIAPEPTESEVEDTEGRSEGAAGGANASTSVPQTATKQSGRTLEAELSNEDRRSQIAFLEAKNSVDRDAAAEAEASGKDPVVGWLLGALDRLDPDAGEESSQAAAKEDVVGGDEVAEDVANMSVNT